MKIGDLVKEKELGLGLIIGSKDGHWVVKFPVRTQYGNPLLVPELYLEAV